MTIISARFSDIHADDLSRIKAVLESLGFEIDEIKPHTTAGNRTFYFSINSTLEIVK